MCGEKFDCALYNYFCVGSPPRVRGKAHAVIKHKRSLGITPACAGKRQLRAAHKAADTDHPRVCGEKLKIANGQLRLVVDHPRVCGEKSLFTSHNAVLEGSPPRVRGKV